MAQLLEPNGRDLCEQSLGRGSCRNVGTMVLYAGEEDKRGKLFCDSCGFAAMESGDYVEADDL